MVDAARASSLARLPRTGLHANGLRAVAAALVVAGRQPQRVRPPPPRLAPRSRTGRRGARSPVLYAVECCPAPALVGEPGQRKRGERCGEG